MKSRPKNQSYIFQVFTKIAEKGLLSTPPFGQLKKNELVFGRLVCTSIIFQILKNITI